MLKVQRLRKDLEVTYPSRVVPTASAFSQGNPTYPKPLSTRLCFWQRRVDLSLARALNLPGSATLELRWDVFNVFDTVNDALPENVIGEEGTDFGKITGSVGGPRVMQFGLNVKF